MLDQITTKICTQCKLSKSLSMFHNSNGPKGGPLHKQARCKSCNSIKTKQWNKNNREKYLANTRNLNLKRLYGMSLLVYEIMKEEQHGLCAICKREADLVVDHDHRTGTVRGLLCQSCNRGMGMLGEDNLQSAMAYVQANG